MANIMDIIRKYKGRTTQTAEAAPGSLETGGTGVVRQNMQMDAARSAQNRAIMKEAGDASAEGQIMEEQRKQANLQRDEQITSIGRQNTQEKQRYELTADKIMTNLEQSRDKLTDAERMDQMEAASSYLRLQDDKYRYEIADIGRRKRLDDKNNLDFEMQQAIFADELEVFRGNITFQKMMTMDDAAFRKSLAEIDVQAAIDLARSDAVAASERTVISGFGGAAAGAVGAYAQSQAGKPKTTTTTEKV
jgi:hypothetical protein